MGTVSVIPSIIIKVNKMTDILTIQQNFELAESIEEKFQLLVKLSKNLSIPIDKNPSVVVDLNTCEYNISVLGFKSDAKVYYYFSSNSVLIKGFLAIISEMFCGKTRSEIVSGSVELFNKINFGPYFTFKTKELISKIFEIIKKIAEE